MSGNGSSAEGVPVFSAFNALLGYIGGQAATKTIFERLFWPQRYFSSVNMQTIPHLLFLYPMTGPIGVAALEVLDTVYKNGLFKGADEGHILGTHFYQDLGWTYKLHALGGEPERESQVRNCIWIQALLALPLPAAAAARENEEIVARDVYDDIEVGRQAGEEKTASGIVTIKGEPRQPILRSRISVNHLILSKASPEDLSNRQIPFTSEATDKVRVESILGIFLAEATGIGIMICVAVILRSNSIWSILFIVPLLLRLLSAFFAVEREAIKEIPDSVNTETHRDWEINCPAIEGKFMLISGPPTIANQFFRHYGHPVRNRFREVVQLILVILFATYFPVVILCQVAWMPVTIQYIWTVWQVWTVIVMHLDRYTQRSTWRSSTDANIALTLYKKQQQQAKRGGDGANRCNEVPTVSILFGQHRRGSAVVKATLVTTIADNYGDGKKIMKSLIRT